LQCGLLHILQRFMGIFLRRSMKGRSPKAKYLLPEKVQEDVGGLGPQNFCPRISDSPSSNRFCSWDPGSLSPAHFPPWGARKFGAVVTLRINSTYTLHPSSQHCEHHIQSLQTRVLELQQQLAVAVAADRKKDIMIEQLDKVPGYKRWWVSPWRALRSRK
jgi:hypothetical protein